MTTVTDRTPARQSAPPERRRLRRTVGFALPPLTAYLLGHVLYWTAAARTGYHYFTVAGHWRWDSAFYEQVADGGYQLFHCNPQTTPPDQRWCGNAGWFPLYPWLIRAVQAPTGLSVGRAAVLVAELGTVAAVLLFWWLLTRPAPADPGPAGGALGPPGQRLRNVALLALVTVFPVGVYFHAIFPMSVAVTATLACLALATRRRWLLAGLAGAVAAAAYPIGIVAGLAAVGVAAVLAGRERAGWRRFLGQAGVVGALSLTGLLLVFVVMQVTVGHWNAFFLSQDKYGGQRYNPVAAFLSLVSQAQVSPEVGKATPGQVHRLDLTVRTEMWASLGLVLLCCAAAVVAAVRRRFVPLDAGLVVFAVVTFLVPLFAGTQISQYRSHALLLPALLLLRHLPGWLLALLTVPTAVLAYKMGTLFYLWLLF